MLVSGEKRCTRGLPRMDEDEGMTGSEMQRFLNQQAEDGKTETEAYRNLMDILGIKFPEIRREQ